MNANVLVMPGHFIDNDNDNAAVSMNEYVLPFEGGHRSSAPTRIPFSTIPAAR